MSAKSSIEWTHHTFNPWWGCAKVSPGCKHCYAEGMAARLYPDSNLWGQGADRRPNSEDYWQKPLAWDRKAKKQRERHRVFCASMADVFEDSDFIAVIEGREKLWTLIDSTSYLDWLLLTKRPENISAMLPPPQWVPRPAPNVWLGTSVESQQWADKRIPELLKEPAVVRFLSAEPLLGPLDLSEWLGDLQWVITGGESGPKARPMQYDWVRSIRDQCQQAGVAFFHKQNGEFAEDGKRVGKKAAGRVLDVRTWDEFPTI